LSAFWVITPAKDLEYVGQALKALVSDDRFRLVSELEICPELANAGAISGWDKQQLLKLAIYERVDTKNYLTLDADIICVREFDGNALFHDGRALCGVETFDDYTELYTENGAAYAREVKQQRVEWAERILGFSRPKRFAHMFYSETPVLLNTNGVRLLAQHIAKTHERPWREALLSSLPWTEFPLYFQFLENCGLLEKMHAPQHRNTMLRLDQSLWLPSDFYQNHEQAEFKNWDPSVIFNSNKDGFFVAIQSYLEIPVEEVWTKVKPYLNIPAVGETVFLPEPRQSAASIYNSGEIAKTHPDRSRSSSIPELTIGMATYNDYDGVYFTLEALRLYQDLENVELLVIDNYGCDATRKLVEQINGRYHRATDIVGTSAPRDTVFQLALGSAVLCCDCHILFVPGAIARLKQYYRDHPETNDLLQGPLLSDDGKTIATHFDPVWRDMIWGAWGKDPRGEDPTGEPFEIPMQGLGVFSSRKSAWLGFNSGFRGFGGEEGYIHEKFRQVGRRCLCLPWFRWMHRFYPPGKVTHNVIMQDRIINYLLGHLELGLSIEPVIAYFKDHIFEDTRQAILELERRHPNYLPELRRQLTRLGA
jgi:glycosyltransferase involved in cell wall biosynthesis